MDDYGNMDFADQALEEVMLKLVSDIMLEEEIL